MIKEIILRVSTFLFVFFVAGCGGGNISQFDYMILEDILYVDKFPQTFSLEQEVEVDTDIIGIKDFCIYDSLLILSTVDKEGLWSFVSLSDDKFLGKFLTRGQGPHEFSGTPYVGGSGVDFFKEEEGLCATVYNFGNGEFYKMNIDESIKANLLNIYKINDSLPSFLFNFIAIDSTTYFCKEVDGKRIKQIRYILDRGKKVIPSHFERLNLSHIREREDINILSTSTKYNHDKKLFVEMPIGLNYINMYSMNSSFGKTICVGGRLDNINKIQDKDRWERLYTFADLRLFSKFWGVVYINEDEKTYQTERKRLPSILLFDWDGRPLAELKLNNFITSFDIDFINGVLYTLDVHTDMFCKYEIQDILDKL